MNQERVIVQPPLPGRNDPQPATCFAIMHPLHGEPFSRPFSDLATYRRLRDHQLTGTYVALEVATLDGESKQWISSQPDVFYGGSLFTGERQFLPASRRGQS